MISRIVLVALITAATPAIAADLNETHQEVNVPAGKLHARAHRPLAAAPCTTTSAAHPVGGKMPAATSAALARTSCAPLNEAEAATKTNKG